MRAMRAVPIQHSAPHSSEVSRVRPQVPAAQQNSVHSRASGNPEDWVPAFAGTNGRGRPTSACLIRVQAGDLRREGNLARAEIVVVVFDEAGEDVGEGIFTADADGPSRARLPRRVSSPKDDRGRPIIVALPGAAAPDVAEEAIPGVADTAGHARQRPDLAVIGNADLARAVVAALGIRPGIVALNADHKAAGELIVATDLGAADEAMLIVFAERLAVKGAAGGAHDPVLLRGPQTARVAAEEAARPAPSRDDRRRRLVAWQAHVGRDRRASERNQRGRCDQDFPHHLAPAMRGAVCNAGAWDAVADQPHTSVDLRKRRRRPWRALVAFRALSPADLGLIRLRPIHDAEGGQNPSWDSTIMTPRLRHTFFA